MNRQKYFNRDVQKRIKQGIEPSEALRRTEQSYADKQASQARNQSFESDDHIDFDSSINGNGTRWHDSDDL